MGSQISGATPANIAEVEAATKALRSVVYPEDYTTNGNYSAANASGLMAAGIAANANIVSLRWTHATKLALIKRVTLSAGVGATAFAAGAGIFHMFPARSFSASDSGGSAFVPSGNINKLKTSMAASQMGDLRISSTAALTAGTRTLDGAPVGTLVAGIPATAGAIILSPFPIFEAVPGEYPLVLAQNEGFVIQCTMPATGTWQFGVRVEWGERDSYF